MKHFVILLIAVILLVKASKKTVVQKNNSKARGSGAIPIAPRVPAQEQGRGIVSGSSTSPPISIFTGEDFDELFDSIPQLNSNPSLGRSTSDVGQQRQTVNLTKENILGLQNVVSDDELGTINQLCKFLMNYFADRENVDDQILKRKNVGMALGIMDRLLTIFDGITNRVESETQDYEQIEIAKEYMERVRRDIHQMKSILSNPNTDQ